MDLSSLTYSFARDGIPSQGKVSLLVETSFGIRVGLTRSEGNAVAGREAIAIATYSPCCLAQPFLSRQAQEQQLRWRCQDCHGPVPAAIKPMEWLTAYNDTVRRGGLLSSALVALAGHHLDPLTGELAGQALANVIMEAIEGSYHLWKSQEPRPLFAAAQA